MPLLLQERVTVLLRPHRVAVIFISAVLYLIIDLFIRLQRYRPDRIPVGFVPLVARRIITDKNIVEETFPEPRRQVIVIIYVEEGPDRIDPQDIERKGDDLVLDLPDRRSGARIRGVGDDRGMDLSDL